MTEAKSLSTCTAGRWVDENRKLCVSGGYPLLHVVLVDVLEDILDAIGELPIRVIRLEGAEVADVPLVIADAGFV